MNPGILVEPTSAFVSRYSTGHQLELDMLKPKLLLLDKDGTLVAPGSGERFVQHPQDQVVLPGVREGIAYYVAQGAVPVIISNQGGVAAHHKTLIDAIAEMRYCMELLNIETGCFCPDFEG